MTAFPFSLAVLAEGLAAYLDRPIEIVDVKDRPLATSSHPISRVKVTLASGESISVIVKRPRPGEKLYGNEREVLIYRRVLRGQRFGAPALYASVYDVEEARYELFLEDVGRATLAYDVETWRAAARWLADMHATFLGREDELRAFGCLMEHDAVYYAMVAETARRNLELAEAHTALTRFDRLMSWYDSLVAYLVSQPRTFVHGDVFDDNIIMQAGPRIRAVDWESAAIGLGAWDLVRLLDGWGADNDLLRSVYLEEFEQRAGGALDGRAFDKTFDHCRILNRFWRLRWSVDKCRDAAFVDYELTQLEALCQGLEGASRDG